MTAMRCEGNKRGEEMDRSAPVMNRAIAIVGRATLVVAVLILGTPAAHAAGVTYPTLCNNGGMPVSGKVVLTQDIICTDAGGLGSGAVNGLTVGAPNTTIFLNGFSIKCFDPRPSGPLWGPLPAPNSYKFSCQGDFQIMGGFFADTGIDTCGFSNVQIKGPGMIQGFSVGVRMRGRAPTNTTGPCGAGAANLTGPSANNVKVQKLNVTGPDGLSDISDPLAGPRPKSFGILASNFIENPTTCPNWDSDDGHTHGNEIFGSSVENHVLGIALYNASRVNVHENFVHDNNSAGESTTCPNGICVTNSGTNTTITDGDTIISTECGFGQKCESHGIVVCANTSDTATYPPNGPAFACTTGVSFRNKIQNNLVVDNAQNSFGTSTAPDKTDETNEQVDGGLSLIGNALKNDVRNNTVLSNNGDGISVRNGADLNRFSSNTSLMNSTTQTTCVFDPIANTTTCTPHFWDLTFRGAGHNNIFNSSNRCLTQSPSNGWIPAGTCNPNENTTWWQP